MFVSWQLCSLPTPFSFLVRTRTGLRVALRPPRSLFSLACFIFTFNHIQLELSCALHRSFVSGRSSDASSSPSFLVASRLSSRAYSSISFLSLRLLNITMGNLIWHDLARFISLAASICMFNCYMEIEPY